MTRFHFALMRALSPLPFLAFAACGNDPPANPAPVLTAAFTVNGTQQVGQPIRFDATASVDPGGGGLTYSWSFGDATHGGTREIAHLYAQTGTYPVQLTVRDAAGTIASASQTVAVAAGPAASGAATVEGRVTLTDGTALSGATVSVQGAAATATTGAGGDVTVSGVPVGVPAVLRISRSGYLTGTVRLDLPAGSTQGYFEAVLVPRRAAVILPTIEAGGTANGADGVRVQVPAGAIWDAAGNPATGAVDVEMTPIDLRTEAAAFPGEFAGVQPNGQKTAIASLGVADATLTRAGQPVRVAPGRTVTLELPIYVGTATLGQTIPLWSLSEAAGTWVQEGTGTVVASSGSPTGLALRGEVAHFSPWNVDIPYIPVTIRPHCLVSATVPLAVPCWVKVTGSLGTPVTGSGTSIAPGQSITVSVMAGATIVVTAQAAGGLYGQSAPVTPTTGTLDVNVVLSGAAPPIDLIALGGDGPPTILAFDGASWLTAISPFDGTSPSDRGEALAWNGALWVAGGRGPGPALATSPDGLSWTPAASAASIFTSVSGVATNGALWVAVGTGPGGGFALATSPNGQAWTPLSTPVSAGAGPGRAVAWNGTSWLVGGDALGGVLTSTSGTTWTLTPTSFGGQPVRALAWNGVHWLAAAGSLLASSNNGTAWTTQPSPVVNPRAVAWNGMQWAVGGSQAVAFGGGTSWNTTAIMTADIHGLAWTGTRWLAVGSGPGGPAGGMFFEYNGFTWITAPLPFVQTGRALAFRRPLYPPL